MSAILMEEYALARSLRRYLPQSRLHGLGDARDEGDGPWACELPDWPTERLAGILAGWFLNELRPRLLWRRMELSEHAAAVCEQENGRVHRWRWACQDLRPCGLEWRRAITERLRDALSRTEQISLKGLLSFPLRPWVRALDRAVAEAGDWRYWVELLAIWQEERTRADSSNPVQHPQLTVELEEGRYRLSGALNADAVEALDQRMYHMGLAQEERLLGVLSLLAPSSIEWQAPSGPVYERVVQIFGEKVRPTGDDQNGQGES